MNEDAREEASRRSEAKRRGLASRASVVVSVSDDAKWFEPFLRETLPPAIPAQLAWGNTRGARSNVLIETPLRTHDYGRLVPDDCLRVLISGEPYPDRVHRA